MNNNELFPYRNQLIRDSISFKKTDRIAHISNFWLWKVHDAGLTITETLADSNKKQKVVTEHQAKYNFDLIIDYCSRGPGALYHFLEGDCFVVDDEKGFLSVKDDPVFNLSDYDLLIKDFGKLLWEVALPRKFARLRRHLSKEDYGQILNLYSDSGNYLRSIVNVMKEQFGLPSIPMANSARIGMELLGCGRGIKGISADLRRDLGKVKAAVEVFDSMFLDPTINLLNSLPAGPDMENPVDTMSTMMFHTILNQKQWENVYWPSLKKALDTAVKTNSVVHIGASRNAPIVGQVSLWCLNGNDLHCVPCFKDCTNTRCRRTKVPGKRFGKGLSNCHSVAPPQRRFVKQIVSVRNNVFQQGKQQPIRKILALVA